MLTSLRDTACMAALVGAITCISSMAYGGDPISKEITQKYVEAGGVPITVRSWGGLGTDLPGQVPGFHFNQAPTGKLPAIPVPCGLTLSREMFYSNLPVRPIATGAAGWHGHGFEWPCLAISSHATRIKTHAHAKPWAWHPA
jgi:hypothetical protein